MNVSDLYKYEVYKTSQSTVSHTCRNPNRRSVATAAHCNFKLGRNTAILRGPFTALGTYSVTFCECLEHGTSEGSDKNKSIRRAQTYAKADPVQMISKI